MSKLVPSLQNVKDTIADLYGQMTTVNPESEVYASLTEKMAVLIKRRKLLETYNVERLAQVDKVNAVIDARLKKLTEKLEGERMERLANIEHDYEDKLKELPPISCPLGRQFGTRVGTLKLVAQHMKRYADDFKTVPVKMNFFHAAACSNWMKYVSTEFEGRYHKLTTALWSQAKFHRNTRFPLALADINRMIHLPSYDQDIFIILDTSLRVILTNAGFCDTQKFPCLVVYDSNVRKFAPISKEDKNKNSVCPKCFRYLPMPHFCQHLCPICLRTGDDVNCSKPSSNIKFQTCSKCDANCQTNDCFRAHKKVCPRPFFGLHDDIMRLIKINV